MSAGYYQMARGWQENAFFSDEPFTEREAWLWLIENAAWKPSSARIKGATISLERGQLCFAQRFLAEKWRWSKSRVDRFLKRLAAESMISVCSKNGATAGHKAGQGQSIITVCNYDKYQSPKEVERGNDEPQNGATAGQQRGKEEEYKEGKEERKKGTAPDGARRYAFIGKVIRLTPADFDQWRSAYPDVSLMAQLQSRDDWLATEADEATRKKWFVSTSNYLASLQAKSDTARREANNARDRITV